MINRISEIYKLPTEKKWIVEKVKPLTHPRLDLLKYNHYKYNLAI